MALKSHCVLFNSVLLISRRESQSSISENDTDSKKEDLNINSMSSWSTWITVIWIITIGIYPFATTSIHATKINPAPSNNNRSLLESTPNRISPANPFKFIPLTNTQIWYHYDSQFKSTIYSHQYIMETIHFHAIRISNKPLNPPRWHRYVAYRLTNDLLHAINERRRDEGLPGVVRIIELYGHYYLALWDQVNERLLDEEFGIHNSYFKYDSDLTFF